MPASPATLPCRTRSDGISRARIQDPALVELVDDRDEFEGVLNDWTVRRGERLCGDLVNATDTTVPSPAARSDDRPMTQQYRIGQWQRWQAFRRRYRWELKNGRRP